MKCFNILNKSKVIAALLVGALCTHSNASSDSEWIFLGGEFHTGSFLGDLAICAIASTTGTVTLEDGQDYGTWEVDPCMDQGSFTVSDTIANFGVEYSIDFHWDVGAASEQYDDGIMARTYKVVWGAQGGSTNSLGSHFDHEWTNMSVEETTVWNWGE